jgi:hypothetical protein
MCCITPTSCSKTESTFICLPLCVCVGKICHCLVWAFHQMLYENDVTFTDFFSYVRVCCVSKHCVMQAGALVFDRQRVKQALKCGEWRKKNPFSLCHHLASCFTSQNQPNMCVCLHVSMSKSRDFYMAYNQ